MQFTSCWTELRLSSPPFAAPPPPQAKESPFLFLGPLPTHCKKKEKNPPPYEVMTSCCQPISLYGATPGSLPAFSAFRLTRQHTFPHPAASQLEEHREAEESGGGRARGDRGGLRIDNQQTARCPSQTHIQHKPAYHHQSTSPLHRMKKDGNTAYPNTTPSYSATPTSLNLASPC